MDNTLRVTELIAGAPQYSTSLFTAGISRWPTTPGQRVIVLHSSYLFALGDDDQDSVLHFVKHYTREVQLIAGVERCGLAYDGHQCLQIIPMHGLGKNWTPILAPDTDLDETYPGYLWTKSATFMEPTKLEEIRQRVAAASGWTHADHAFDGDNSDNNLFARLVRGEIDQWRIWEDAGHVAFLTPFANVPGATVLVPRKHLISDILNMDLHDFDRLMAAARKVVSALQSGMSIDRVGMFFEGFEIDYAHVKFYPVLGTQEPEGPSDEFHEKYPGYLTTRLGPEIKNAMTLGATE